MTANYDEVNVSIAVSADPATAFRLFTEQIDLWWQRNAVYRTSRQSSLQLEPEVGGRFLDIHATNGQVRVIGRVLVWQPGARLLVEWRGSNFAEQECTQVEVTFVTEGAGTRVAVRHYGWDALSAEHPARHGQIGAAFVRFQSQWWAGLLTSWQQHVRLNELQGRGDEPDSNL